MSGHVSCTHWGGVDHWTILWVVKDHSSPTPHAWLPPLEIHGFPECARDNRSLNEFRHRRSWVLPIKWTAGVNSSMTDVPGHWRNHPFGEVSSITRWPLFAVTRWRNTKTFLFDIYEQTTTCSRMCVLAYTTGTLGIFARHCLWKVYVFCNHRTTEWVMCAVCVSVDTQRLSFPSTAVAKRKATALYQSTSKCCCGCTWRKRAQEEMCGWCGVGIFIHRCGARLWWIIRGTPTFGWKQSWTDSFHCHDLSHNALVHQPPHWDDDEKGGCAFCSSCPRFLPAILYCSRSLAIFTANWYSWCCFTGIVCVLQFAWFSTFPNVSVHATDVVGGILHYQRVFFSFECSSFAVRPSCVRLGSFVVCNLHLFPQRSAQPS